MLYLWGYAEKKGAWISFSEDLRKELKENNLEIPETIQGEAKFNTFIESNEEVKDFLIKFFRELILPDDI